AKDKYDLGNSLLKNGSAESAVFFFDKSLKLNPYYWPAYLKRADALQKLGQASLAKLDYQKAIEINPHCTEAKRKLSALSKGGKSKSRSFEKDQKTTAKKPDTTEKATKSSKATERPGRSKASGFSRSSNSTGKSAAPPTSQP
ncbi:MAG: hypothetical protein K8F91_17715, partial [Candidatus Obscuribacterales bacterium]|nr:hypothetical protein [Candidatus Obscuribacterales bacterium]